MLNWIKSTGYLIGVIAISWSLQACSDYKESASKKHSIVIGTKAGDLFIWQTDNLDSGSVDVAKQGVKLIGPPRIWYYLLVNKGFYYYVNPKTEYFVKSQIQGNRFVHLDSTYLPTFSYPDNALFFDSDTVFFINHSMGLKPKSYAKVAVKDMASHIDTLPIPKPFRPFDNMSVGFEFCKKDQLWLGYTYHYSNPKMGYGSSDTVYVAEMRYSDMKLAKIQKDPRSTYPGNVNTAQQNTFVDEKGDFYFMSCPGIVRGANENQPTAIYRIKADEDEIDSTFFFNVSASKIQNHAYGMWNIGHQKVLIRSERRDLFKSYKEHYMVPHIEYYELNLTTGEISKLNLPLDRGSSRTCVLVEGEKAYITINDGKGNNDIWIYRAANRSLSKGLHFKGDVDYIVRLEHL